MIVLGRFGSWRRGCAERRGRRKAGKPLKTGRNAAFAGPEFRHGFVIEI
jgi:hypothetical protein